jgi:hypothetical protein
MGIGAIAAVAGAAATIAATGATVHQGQQQAHRAEEASDAQANEAKRQRDTLLEKQKQEEASTAAKEARNRMKINAGGGKKSTVLTSPVGLPGLQNYGGQTYLGGGQG